MAKKSITKNYIYNVLYQLLTILTPLITTPYVSRILGADGIGQYELTQATVQYFILIGTIGLNMYGQREIAYVQDDVQKRSNLFWELTLLRIATMSVSIAVYFAFVPFSGKYKWLYYIQFLDLLANLIDVAWFFQGLEEFRLTVVRNVIIRIVGILCIFLWVRKESDVPLFTLAHSLPLLLANLSLWSYLKKYIKKPVRETIVVWRHLRPALLLFVPQIAAQVYLVLDKTMIHLLTNLESEVGLYSNAQKIIRLLLTIVTSLCTVMLPRMSFAYAQKEFDKMREYMHNSFSFAYFVAIPMMFGIMGVAKNFVPVFFGEGWDGVVLLMQVLSFIIVWIAFSNIVGFQFLLPTQKQTQYTISITAGAVTNFVLNLCLIPKFQSLGAAIATVIAELMVTVVQFYFIREEFSIGQILKGSVKFLLAGFGMFCVVSLVGMKLHGVVGLAIQVLAGVISYVVFLIVLQEQTLREVVQKVRKR